jgi:ABC-type dipeptide/oligopeptide/nickel transport system ATPase component
MKPIADEMHVMYKGRVIESDHPVELFSNPKTAYTKKLISSIPTLNPADKVFG